MPRDPRLALWDIEEAIEDIVTYTENRTLAQYSADRPSRRIVERSFEIIGEALVRLARDFPAEIGQIANYRKFIGLRNVLAHQYDGIDNAIVWQVAEDSLSTLKEQVILMRKALDAQDPL